MTTEAKAKVVKRAIQLLETKGWCQGHEALTLLDIPVHALHPEAACFCIMGAIRRGIKDVGAKKDTIYDISFQLGTFIDMLDVTRFNDTEGRTKEEIIALLEKALEFYSSTPLNLK